MSTPIQRPLDKTYLLGFLKEINKHLTRKITLVAAGGTAMTLLNLKSSTLDVDFTGPRDHIESFEQIIGKIPHGIVIDTYYDGTIYSQMLPDDYLDKSIPIREASELSRIDLRSLHPLDIVVTKAGRLNERDKADISSCIKSWSLTKGEIISRGEYVAKRYPANEGIYRTNLESIVSQIS